MWFVSWMYLIKESPEKDHWISEDEKLYIQKSLVHKEGHKHVVHPPWKAIATSPAVWAISAAQFAELWGFYTMLTQLPTFLKGSKYPFCSQIPYLIPKFSSPKIP
jgi:ACS family sodium-dependent inorganic phosphate cotransporter